MSLQHSTFVFSILKRRVASQSHVTARRMQCVRYNSSINNKIASNNSTTTTRTVGKDKADTPTTTSTSNATASVTAASLNNTNDTEEKSEKIKPATIEKLPFVPVINIPKTEFAYHSFFSLHRPFFGLADDSDRPFFSNRTIEEEAQDKFDDALADCMKDLQPFVPPEDMKYKASSEQMKMNHNDKFDFGEDIDDAIHDEDLLFYSEFNRKSSLPIHHMPDSSEVIDFLSDVESKMKLEEEEAAEIEQRLQTINKAKKAKRRYQPLKSNKRP
ncbi:hypothetical protein BDF20DRAFT_909766 [Mycotypha africana]|uniref:uncharacterized protein n=1 Tax=Mycotypha africana TaxID=64632 RepID=UPI002300FAC2|nr:uncharacterized protein BDF20DRAFT_909766 [Mycotypha africana]KAI8992082.1 hypothetical protein BDF20DRAFT_909766 [Mycotypha africana]